MYMPDITGDHYDLLKGTDLFAEIDDETLHELRLSARALTFRKNTVLISEGETGESLYIIKSGNVNIYVSDDQGNEIVLSNLGPGSYFGEVSLLDNEPRTASAITLERTEIVAIAKADFMICVEKHPKIALIVIRTMTRHLRRATVTIRSLALENVYQRLSSKLKELSVLSADTAALQRRYSNHELATMIGASREMVGKILNDLADGGYIEKRNNRWFLLREFPANW